MSNDDSQNLKNVKEIISQSIIYTGGLKDAYLKAIKQLDFSPVIQKEEIESEDKPIVVSPVIPEHHIFNKIDQLPAGKASWQMFEEVPKENFEDLPEENFEAEPEETPVKKVESYFEAEPEEAPVKKVEEKPKEATRTYKKDYLEEPPEDWGSVDKSLSNVINKRPFRVYWDPDPYGMKKQIPTSYNTLPEEYAQPYGLSLLDGKIIFDDVSPW